MIIYSTNFTNFIKSIDSIKSSHSSQLNVNLGKKKQIRKNEKLFNSHRSIFTRDGNVFIGVCTLGRRGGGEVEWMGLLLPPPPQARSGLGS